MNSFSVGQDNLTWVMELLNSINMSPHNIINGFTDYSAYFFWVSVLFLLLFSPVLIILGFIYFSNFLLHIYKRKVNLKEDYLSQSWDNGRRAVAHLWDMYGTVWHEEEESELAPSYRDGTSLLEHLESPEAEDDAAPGISGITRSG